MKGRCLAQSELDPQPDVAPFNPQTEQKQQKDAPTEVLGNHG